MKAWPAALLLVACAGRGTGIECRWTREPDDRARFSWDREFLYFSGRTRLVLKPSDEHPGTYEIDVDADGTIRAAFLPRPGERIDLHAPSKGRLAWSEMARTGGRPEPGERWAFSDSTTLLFVGPEAAPRIPPDLSRVRGSPEPPPPYRVRRDFPNLTLPFPIAVAHEPGSRRLWILNQVTSWGGAGRILRMPDDPACTEAEELVRLDAVAYGLAFHPRYPEQRHIFVGMNGPAEAKPKFTRVVRYTVAGESPVLRDPLTVIEWESDGHNGGDVAFDRDGMLLVTSGDGTSDSDRNVAGQRLDHLLAKTLRIDVDRPDPGKAYGIPPDNPFVDRAGVRAETFAYGLRNPWRLHVDRATGDVWVGNNGQDTYEQVYLVRRGANYGWSVVEGSHPFMPARAAGPDPISRPIAEHPHSEARSLTGGVVYTGSSLPELRGSYLYGDYSTGRIWAIRPDQGLPRELADTTLQITGFAADSRGELLIVDHAGGLYRLEAAPPSPPSTFPRRLSESGLFASVPGHRVARGLVPYTVNSPLWSDGAAKERFLAVPEGERITFGGARGWNFPDRTVIVKSFAIEDRWIETRFLMKQEGEWSGVSYAWNDAQTDAELVEAGGRDREIVVRTPAGERRQTWHYPSRSECMTCHTRASNFVLGLSTAQMNRDGADGVNQLERLEGLELLKVDWAGEIAGAIRAEAVAEGLKPPEADARVKERTSTSGQRGAPAASLLAFPPVRYPKLADPYDRGAALDARARSYLHANCAICHIEAGGGNAKMELEFATRPEAMNLLDATPVHDGYGLPDARLVAPGAPERSVLLHRVSIRGRGQMPPLATSVVDEQAVELLRDWIRSKPGR